MAKLRKGERGALKRELGGAFPEWWDNEVCRFLPTRTGECF